MLYAISKKSSKVEAHNIYSQIITAAITVGFGGSTGLEAPIVTSGSAIGSNLAVYSVYLTGKLPCWWLVVLLQVLQGLLIVLLRELFLLLKFYCLNLPFLHLFRLLLISGNSSCSGKVILYPTTFLFGYRRMEGKCIILLCNTGLFYWLILHLFYKSQLCCKRIIL